MDNTFSFPLAGVASVLIFIAGLYCVMMSKDLIRALIGVALLAKAVALLVITAGFSANRVALAQTLVITMIVIEVAVTAVAIGVVLSLFRHEKSTDARIVRGLKG